MWQPIETAPKDGTKIIVHVPATVIPVKKGRKTSTRRTHSFTVMARWYDKLPKQPCSEHRAELLKKHGGYWSAHFRGEKPLHARPTHWMPVPPDPIVEEDSDNVVNLNQYGRVVTDTTPASG